MEQEKIGKFTINHESAIELGTVTVQGFPLPGVLHSEDGPDAFEKCKAWAKDRIEKEAQGDLPPLLM